MGLAAGFDPFEKFYKPALKAWKPNDSIYLKRSWKNDFIT